MEVKRRGFIKSSAAIVCSLLGIKPAVADLPSVENDKCEVHLFGGPAHGRKLVVSQKAKYLNIPLRTGQFQWLDGELVPPKLKLAQYERVSMSIMVYRGESC